MDQIRVASSQYWIRPVTAWAGFADQVESVVRTSADYGSKLVVLPEYFTSQLLSLGDMRRPIREQVHGLTTFLPAYLELFTVLARKHKIYIVAGSIPVRAKTSSHRVFNESYLFAPSGKHGVQGKLHMTRFENEEWKISPHSQLKVFDTDFGKLAIAICYDVEFPELVRAAAKAGAEIIAVPSCTDNRQGWLRVRYCAQARAIENQVYLIHSSTVGGLAQVPSVHLNYGLSSILTPSDYAFARDGVLAEGTANQETIVIGDLSLKRLAASRKSGTVIPLHDSARSLQLSKNVKKITL
jgi:predicted amidohydrolase